MKNKRDRLIRLVVLILALVLLAAGLLTGGSTDIMSNAVMICMECIGIG
ncbi:MAG: hypothetical protein IKR56_06825 [Lachnospiraceae bacterium]|nr:hypothetical protein [Lachnospiraceae bacterium]